MASLTLVIENRIKVSIMKQRDLDIEADEMHGNCTAVLTACRDILARAAEHDRFTFSRQLAAASRSAHHKPHYASSRQNTATSSRSFAHPAPRTSPSQHANIPPSRSPTVPSTTEPNHHRVARKHPTLAAASASAFFRTPPSSKPTHPSHTHRSTGGTRTRPHLSASPPKVGTSVRRLHRQALHNGTDESSLHECGSCSRAAGTPPDPEANPRGEATQPWYLRSSARLVFLSLSLMGSIWPFIEQLRLEWWLHLRKGYGVLGTFG